MHPFARIMMGGGLLLAMLCVIASTFVSTSVFPEADLDTFLHTTPGTILGIVGSLGVMAAIIGLAFKVGSGKDWSFGGGSEYDD